MDKKFFLRMLGSKFSILGKMNTELKKAGVPSDRRKQILSEAQSGNDNKVLETLTKYFNVEFS